MNFTKVLLVFSILRGVAPVSAKQFNGLCTVWVNNFLCIEEGGCDDSQLVCEDGEGNFYQLIGPTSDDIENAVNDGSIDSGHFMFDPNQEENVTFDGESLVMNYSSNFTLNDLTTSVSITEKDRYSPTTGDNKMLLVIIDATDYNVDYSPNQLSSDVFGTHSTFTDEDNANSVYRACSDNQLRIFPGTPPPGKEDFFLARGTIRVKIDIPLNGSSDYAIMNAARLKAQEQLGISLPGTGADQYDNIYYAKKGCYPNACAYAAYAGIGSYYSMYQGGYITYSGVQVHEHGHNLGLYHSGEGTLAYGDHSCSMGNPLYRDDASKMCFNPAKSWAVGWYTDSYVEYNEGEKLYVKLIGVGEWTSESPENVVVKIDVPSSSDDLYVGFNRKAGANEDNVEFSDLVTVIKANNIMSSPRSYQSWIEANMREADPPYENSDAGVAVKVCKIVTNEVPGYADVVIYNPTTSSGGCVRTPTAQPVPTPLPTDSPTPFVRCQEKILPNEYQGFSVGSSAGLFFVYNVTAHTDMIIDTFYLKFQSTANINVWTKRGNYEGFEEKETAWTRIVENISMETGEIRKDDFTPVKIDKGAEQSFYLQVSGTNVYCKRGDKTGDLDAENEDLSIFWGSRTTW
eukprot:CAMPEP_0113308788 /NCGR_PEP_ID=MMETSP0010_2-20120614/7098_1 /TAXON_ID=216773 ORGANISM="Corethron hystrix, Strain 308" /NCGR_SAMPLE_ID=MMETSP0010_2 /ASSEMBLY_ACC=CAM_ASM_000155 /LENGTH=626 /DNA_ID=CAMNT_0000163923 /DNA_START=152 /DNA_END=2029 /DNA_ORIENTATION=+ /assembly_acc=CAM_ASM_000155